MPARQTAEEFAKANGFASFDELRAVSRHIPAHDGPRQFVALAPDGSEFRWSEEDVHDLNDGDVALS